MEGNNSSHSKILNPHLIKLMCAILIVSNSQASVLNFDSTSTAFGVSLGSLLGFTPRAAVAGAPKCVPHLIFALDAAIIMNYYDEVYQQQS